MALALTLVVERTLPLRDSDTRIEKECSLKSDDASSRARLHNYIQNVHKK